MAVSTILSSFGSLVNAIFSQPKSRNVGVWKVLMATFIVVIVGCHYAESQTFQYSRGWTNGKRSGGEGGGFRGGEWSGQLFDVGNGVVGVPLEEPSLSVPTVHMNLGPQGRVRSLDYNQFLNRKSGAGSSSSNSISSRKQPPLWIGTVMGLDQDNNSNNNNNADF